MPFHNFKCALVLVLLASGGFVLQGQTRTSPTDCGNGSSARVERDGKRVVYRGEYCNAEYEFRVLLPDGVAAVAGFPRSSGFNIYLTHPASTEWGGDFPWSRLWVIASQGHPCGDQESPDRVTQWDREDSERIGATELQLVQRTQTSLASMPAVDWIARRTDPNQGKVVYEAVAAKRADTGICYVIGMASPADRHEKDHELFKAVLEGFRYVPLVHGENQ